MNTQIEISVILATRNRACSLERLLGRLAEQINAPVFEVIVADNGSQDSTQTIIDRARSHLLIHGIREERPGKSRALNSALKFARGNLIVFTDDDVLPYPDWLISLHTAARDFPICNVFGGRIEVNNEAIPLWVRRSYNLMEILTVAHDRGVSCTHYGYGQYPFGPNMAIRRSLIIGVEKPYPEHLGPGTAQPVGDEGHFLIRFSPPEANDRLFVPSACVFHETETENVAFSHAIIRCFLAGRAHGWLGLPPVIQSIHGSQSTLRLIVQRMHTCRSLRELICMTARYIGYSWGRREHRTRDC